MKLIIAACVLLLSSGCGVPTPPEGWPAGEERPVNAGQAARR